MCPVTAAALTTATVMGTSTAMIASGAVVATSGALFAGVVAGAATGALIGVGANALVNVSTGRGAFDNWGNAALFGAVGGGVASGISTYGGAAGFFSGSPAYNTLSGLHAYAPSTMSIGLSAGAGSLMNAMAPSNVGYTPVGAYNQQAQALNMNTNIATTGSGGRQAATSLAAAISRTKKRKLTQDDIGDLSLDTSSFTNTGLQLA